MPQTRFVLKHAIAAGLKIMVVINKIDREDANPEQALNASLDLMMDLGATDDQLEFAMEHVVYSSAVQGFARLDPDEDGAHLWFWDGFGHADPVKEATAQQMRLANNTTTLAAECAQDGRDYLAVLRQRAKELRLMREMEIPLAVNGNQVPEKDEEKKDDE